MKEAEVFRALHDAGCCYACCARFLGLRNPASYLRIDELAAKYLESSKSAGEPSSSAPQTVSPDTSDGGGAPSGGDTAAASSTEAASNVDSVADTHTSAPTSNGQAYSNGRSFSNGWLNGEPDEDGPSAKRSRREPCACCLDILERAAWAEPISLVTEMLNKRGYECTTFACGLSSPACIILREKSLLYYLREKVPEFNAQNITSLKEVWKWSFGPALEASIGKTLDSGAVCPLLITINMDYDKDAEELETLKSMAPAYYAHRSRNTRQFPLDATRRCVSDVLECHAPPDVVREWFGVPPPRASSAARALSVQCAHAPLYLAGRYIKLSRELSQTPWLVDNVRMMESSVQDVIFAPIAEFYGIRAEDVERRLKLTAAGREDVDVRCLGDGRPFAVEVSDPQRTPTAEQLAELCRQISAGGRVVVRSLRLVGREDLAQLKKGEESKEKTYKALCIKLPRDALDQQDKEKDEAASPSVVTDEDIALIRAYTNGDEACRVLIQQKTPLRVLHRRPLLTRQRRILQMDAERVPGHSSLFTLTLRTQAGTYVKEFVHGDLGRTRPCLRDVLAADVDILALDVTSVDLPW